jgi:hypothetical protein
MADQFNRPWQCLYFLPDPHGHGAFRPDLAQVRGSAGSTSGASPGSPSAKAMAPAGAG